MPLYKVSQLQLELVKENAFKLEKDVQAIVQGNLGSLFGLQLVQSEFSLGGLRIDTLGYDKDAQAFVIIEVQKGVKLLSC